MISILFLSFFIFFNSAFSQSSTAAENFEILFRGSNIVQVVADEGDIWIATFGNGVYRYDSKKNEWIFYSTRNNNIQDDLIYCIEKSPRFIFAGTADGILLFDKRRNFWIKRKFTLGGIYGNWIRTIKYDPFENAVWIGRFENLTKYYIDKNKFIDYNLTVLDDRRTNNFKSIALDGDRFIWFGTEAGVHLYDRTKNIEDPSSRRFYDSRTFAFNKEGDVASINDILVEPDYVWFGLDEFVPEDKPEFNIGGIYRFNRRALWDRIDKNNYLPYNGIASIVSIGNKIFAALFEFSRSANKQFGRGLAIIDKNDFKTEYFTKDNFRLNFQKINSLCFDGINLWLATDNGAIKFKIVNELARFGYDKN